MSSQYHACRKSGLKLIALGHANLMTAETSCSPCPRSVPFLKASSKGVKKAVPPVGLFGKPGRLSFMIICKTKFTYWKRISITTWQHSWQSWRGLPSLATGTSRLQSRTRVLQTLFLNFEHHIFALQSLLRCVSVVSIQYYTFTKKQRVDDIMAFDKD